MSDHNRKTLRSYYCRDYLWELFEVMARDLGCSVDYLVNEAMRHYARSRNYSLAVPAAGGEPAAQSPAHLAHTPPPTPAARRPPPLPGGAAPVRTVAPLFLIFNGQRYQVEKDQYIIGRGSQATDLTIRDGNISRKHCAVVRRDGTYFIKDLGSTNGIELNGKRIEQKRIEEGDVFFLCDYEIRFTYKA